jgi:DNA-binding transcriptional ArsR family regulator
MNENPYQQTARLFQLLSHPARLHILDELRRSEACVCHLQTVLGRPQAYVSQQLRVLREAEVVADRKDGLLVFYRLADQQVERLLENVLGPAGEPTCVPGCPCPHCQTEGQIVPEPTQAAAHAGEHCCTG